MAVKDKQNTPDLDVSNKEMESWFGMLDDASKADVMKAKIAADAATEQCRIKETEQSRRQTETDDDFLVTRTWTRIIGLIAIGASTIVIAVNMNSCVVSHNELAAKTEQARIEAEHPHPCPACQACPTAQAAAPPASAAPASSGK